MNLINKYTLSTQKRISGLRNALFAPRKKVIVLKETTRKEEIPKGEEKRFTYLIKKNYKYYTTLSLNNRRAAIRYAEDPLNPDRRPLYAIYDNTVDDGHVKSVMSTRLLNTLSQEFVVRNPSGSFDDEAKELLEKPWFYNFCKYALESIFYGHSLIEFGRLENGQFNNIYLIEREHVLAPYGEILPDIGQLRGVPYRGTRGYDFMIEVGDDWDLGLLQTASKHVALKNFALTDWSRRNEKFGVPFVAGKTRTSDQKYIDQMAEMLSNIGSNGWAIIDEDDEITFHESKQTDGHSTFKENAELQDKYLSKLFLGQTMTTDDGSSLSQAQVHQNVLQTYTKNDMRFLSFQINLKLIPLLVKHGYPLAGYKFEFWKLTKEYEEQEAQKKKESEQVNEESLSMKTQLHTVDDLHTLYDACGDTCGHEHVVLSDSLPFDLSIYVQEAIRKIYDRELQAGSVDPQLHAQTALNLWNGLQDGYGKQLELIPVDDIDAEFLSQMRTNAYIFSAFKNHHYVMDLVNALLDEDGNVRSFSAFREIAEQISRDYHVHWLLSEYNTAIGTGQMATKWREMERASDVLPYLRYETVGDGRVRPDHRLLEGATYRMDDPFWDIYFPPNGWRCRCSVIQVAGPHTPAPATPEVPKPFRQNVGKTGEMFSKDHPYYTVKSGFEEASKRFFDADIK